MTTAPQSKASLVRDHMASSRWDEAIRLAAAWTSTARPFWMRAPRTRTHAGLPSLGSIPKRPNWPVMLHCVRCCIAFSGYWGAYRQVGGGGEAPKVATSQPFEQWLEYLKSQRAKKLFSEKTVVRLKSA